MLLSASNLRLFYGDVEAFADVSADVGERARIGLVGSNGSGKTSLLRVLVGELEADGGTVAASAGLRIAYVAQMPDQDTAGTLRGVVSSAFAGLLEMEDRIADAELDIRRQAGGARRDAESRYADLLAEYEAMGGYGDYQGRMERVVRGVGLSDSALDTPASKASGGERTRAALAKALLADPDLLVLDEPTNYLDFDGLSWLEDFLASFRYAALTVSHDRYFLDRVCSEIWEMERGRLARFPGNYSKYRRLKREREERRRREFERQREYIEKEEYFIQRYKAGQRSREARGRETRLARLERIEAPQSEKTISIGESQASRTGRVVASLRGLSVGFSANGARTALLQAPDLDLERGSRTAIVGPNGIGKTTLIRTILGEISPLAGTATLGHNVRVGYLHQGTWSLPDGKTVLDAFLEARNLPIGEARGYLARFLFQGDDVFKRVSVLSGGERTRLSLARLLVSAPNVLILDEPTTHLDIPSREALEETLTAYGGALLFVSHDRHFINLMAERVWAIEDGVVSAFNGSFEDWMNLRRPPAPEPPSRRARARHRRRERESRKRESAASANQSEPSAPADYEAEVRERETRVARIERRLARASANQDVEAITRIARQHAAAQKALEEAWEAWERAQG